MLHSLALIMPGEPPSNVAEQGEIEELVTAGFKLHNIVGVEQNYDLAGDLYDYYYDTCQIHWEEIGTFLVKSQRKYSYIHLDFMGMLTRQNLSSIESWMGKLTPDARARVSHFSIPRVNHQVEWEQMLRREFIERLCIEAEKVDEEDPYRWQLYWKQLEESPHDITHLVTIVAAFNFFFGIYAFDYSELCNMKEPFFPPIRGTNKLTNIQRFWYGEPLSNSQMQTVWFDLQPIQGYAKYSTQDTLAELALVFDALVDPIPEFIPNLFIDMEQI